MQSEQPVSTSEGEAPAQQRTGGLASDTDPFPVQKPRLRKPGISALAQLPTRLSFWVPIVTSLASFAIAIWSLIVASSEPEVLLIMPDQVRMAQGGDAAMLYVQPTFLSTGRNDRVEVITGLRLQVAPDQGGGPVGFRWDEQGSWSYDPGTRELTYMYVADARPLLVSPNNPQLPVGVFVGPQGWSFGAGTYRLTFVAERAIGSMQLRGDFKLTFTQKAIDDLNAAQGRRFLTFDVGH